MSALALRDAALLAWLAIEGPTPRERLSALLWPHSSPASARNTLRQRLFQLRKQLGVDLVEGGSQLALAAGVEHDLHDADDVLSGGVVIQRVAGAGPGALQRAPAPAPAGAGRAGA